MSVREPNARGSVPELQAPYADWFAASNVYGTASVGKNLWPLLALYAAIPYAADRSPALAWCFAPLAGILLYRLTMVMHDCGHATLFAARRANEHVGNLLGFITGIDFGRFKRLHWEHHKGYGLPGDPQGFHYLGLSSLTRPAFVWHILKPLLGASVRYVLRESHLHPSNLRAPAANGDILILVPVQLALLLLVTGGGRHPSLALLPFVSASTFGLFLSQLRGIAEHGVGEPGESQALVRSHAWDSLGGLLLYDVNFNFHDASTAIEWIDVHSRNEAACDVSPDLELVRERLHVMDEAGEVHVGADAFAELWAKTPDQTVLARIARVPGLRVLWRRCYNGFAAVLYRWNRINRRW